MWLPATTGRTDAGDRVRQPAGTMAFDAIVALAAANASNLPDGPVAG